MERVEYISFLHKQNLNGRETEDELFEAGILAGIEETEILLIEFAEFCSKYNFNYQEKNWYKRFPISNFPDYYTTLVLYEKFKRDVNQTIT